MGRVCEHRISRRGVARRTARLGDVRARRGRAQREDGARRVRRDACQQGIPAGALAPDQDEQRDRALQSRDQEEDEGRRDLP